MVGSSVVDSHTSPCLCLDALSSNHKGVSGDLVQQRSSIGRKQQLPRPVSLDLSSSFAISGYERRVLANKSTRKQPQQKVVRGGFRIVSELAGQYDDSFEDVKTQVINYFTYKAVRTVMNQLYEMNPPTYRWFYDFVVNNKPGEGKGFLRKLVKENQDLAERVMITRLHLYAKWVKKCDHAAMYEQISVENLELMRERLMETVIWPSDDTSTEMIG